MAYLDTSVVLPYCRPEAISDAVQAYLLGEDVALAQSDTL
jgi:hypothetical protein